MNRRLPLLALAAMILASGLAAVPGGTATASPTAASQFWPLAATRSIDTRDGTGGRQAALPSNGSVSFQMSGRNGIPSSGVTAIVIDITAVAPTATGFINAHATGEARPETSLLNFSAGKTVSNTAVVKVSASGQVTFYNSLGTTHLVADVQGYFAVDTGTSEQFVPLHASRLLDTRDGTGGRTTKIGAGERATLNLSSYGDLPGSGISALVVNSTVPAPPSAGPLTLYAASGPIPATSTTDLQAGITSAQTAIVGVSPDGSFTVHNGTTSAIDLILDIQGYFKDPSASSAVSFRAVTGFRLLDTRTGVGGFTGQLASGQSLDFAVANRGEFPASSGTAVLNVAVLAPQASGHVTLYSPDAPMPETSNLNFVAGVSRANMAFTVLGAGGSVRLYNGAPSPVHVVVDGFGYFNRVAPSAPQDLTVAPAEDGLEVRWAMGSSDGGSPLTNHDVRLTTIQSGNVQQLSTCGGCSALIIDEVPAGEYRIDVAARNAVGTSGFASLTGAPGLLDVVNPNETTSCSLSGVGCTPEDLAILQSTMSASPVDTSSGTGSGSEGTYEAPTLNRYAGQIPAENYEDFAPPGKRRIVPDSALVSSPYRHVVQLKFINPRGKSQVCSGTLAGEDLVVTAAHCVYDRSAKDYMRLSSYRVILAPRSGSTTGYYGFCEVRNMYLETDYAKKGKIRRDLAGLKLDNCTYLIGTSYVNTGRIGKLIGYAGVTSIGDDGEFMTPYTNKVDLIGYPGDGRLGKQAPYPTMQAGSGRIYRFKSDEYGYEIEAVGGDSGAGIRVKSGDAVPSSKIGKITSVHSGNACRLLVGCGEIGKRFDSGDVSMILRWRSWDRN
jgi:V8-like Glu-specific endopeptidase